MFHDGHAEGLSCWKSSVAGFDNTSLEAVLSYILEMSPLSSIVTLKYLFSRLLSATVRSEAAGFSIVSLTSKTAIPAGGMSARKISVSLFPADDNTCDRISLPSLSKTLTPPGSFEYVSSAVTTSSLSTATGL